MITNGRIRGTGCREKGKRKNKEKRGCSPRGHDKVGGCLSYWGIQKKDPPFVYQAAFPFFLLPFLVICSMEFLLAVAQNNIEKARHFIQTGIDVNSPILWNAKDTYSPVLPSDAATRPEVRERLQGSQEYYSRALNIAVLGGYADMTRLLLSAGADINLKDGRGRYLFFLPWLVVISFHHPSDCMCNLAILERRSSVPFTGLILTLRISIPPTCH